MTNSSGVVPVARHRSASRPGLFWTLSHHPACGSHRVARSAFQTRTNHPTSRSSDSLTAHFNPPAPSGRKEPLAQITIWTPRK